MSHTVSRDAAVSLAAAAVAALAVAGIIVAILMMVAMWSGWGYGMGMGAGHMRAMHGGGTDTSGAPATVGGETATVEIRDFTYTPGNLQVPVGAKVTWTNYDGAPHTATAKDGSWDTGILNRDQRATVTFDRAGDYTYYCNVHPNMVARITVR